MNLPFLKTQRGTSLVELLVALVMSGLLTGLLYRTFVNQQQTYHTQEQVIDMQQNLRIAMEQMTREIRMAGYRKDILDSLGTIRGFTEIISVVNGANRVGARDDQITVIIADKAVTYRLGWDATTPTRPVLIRDENNGAEGEVVAEDVEDLQFRYILSDGTVSDSPANPSQIRMVQVEIISRTKRTDHRRSGDGYGRRRLTSSIKVRNLGI
jgi:type IV pilus assembly protein PilW